LDQVQRDVAALLEQGLNPPAAATPIPAASATEAADASDEISAGPPPPENASTSANEPLLR
jgi:hypothetical protein